MQFWRKKIFTLAIAAMVSFAACTTEEETLKDFDEHWQTLLFTEQNQTETQNFCERWLASQNQALQVKARVCLISVAVNTRKEDGFADANSHLQKALQLDPQNFSLHILGITLELYYQRDFTNSLRNSLQRLPEVTLDQWLSAIDPWFQMQQFAAIELYLNLLSERFGETAQLQNELGRFYFMQKNMPLAETHLQKAALLDPDNAAPLLGLGQIYEGQELMQKAKTYYQKAIEMIPEGHEYYQIAQCFYVKFLYEATLEKESACNLAKTNCVEFFTNNCAENP